MKQAILFLTTKSNEWTLRVFHALEQSMKDEADVYLAYHQQGEELSGALQNVENLFVFTSDILNDLGYTPIDQGKLVPGSNHFPLLKFFKENLDYDYYWLVEDDVRFSGEWRTFFDSFAFNSSDFLSSFIETKAENPNWYWWPWLKTGAETICEEKLLKSFNPIYRLSYQALVCADECLKSGWMGHHEILLPTLLYNKGFCIEDIGGDGSFVKPGSKNSFYDVASMGIKPVLPDSRKNYLFHPVKEEKVRKDGPYKENAVFVAAGKNSLHRQLLKDDADFDLHLLIYDGSYNEFCNDADFIACDSGYKMDMTYRYLHRYPELLEKYEYFFLMDDDIEMNTEEVNKLFRMMRKYDLKIAQPSLVMSYYTYEHTLRNPLCILRYTNFVEMMIPCFSREALMKVLPTFERKVRGCGIEYHWSKLIDTNYKDMAILDAVKARHTRPLQPWECQEEMDCYMNENGLDADIRIYSSFLAVQPSSLMESYEDCRKELQVVGSEILSLLSQEMRYSELVPLVAFLGVYSLACNSLVYVDVIQRALQKLYYKPFGPNSEIYPKSEQYKLAKVLGSLENQDKVFSVLNVQPPLVNEKQALENLPIILCMDADYEDTALIGKIKQGIMVGLELLRMTSR